MRFPKLQYFLPAVLLCSQFCAAIPARADTYTFFNIATSGELTFYGMSNTGLVVFTSFDTLPCYNVCYNSYFNGVFVSTSTTAPIFTFDIGTSCTPAAPGWHVDSGRCNNGYEVFSGHLGLDAPTRLLTISGSTITDISPTSAFQFGAAPLSGLNSIGDIVFDDPFAENWWIAVDQNTLPTPEPSSLLLLATGLAGAAVVAARRRAANA
jgi:hypothetical protein